MIAGAPAVYFALGDRRHTVCRINALPSIVGNAHDLYDPLEAYPTGRENRASCRPCGPKAETYVNSLNFVHAV